MPTFHKICMLMLDLDIYWIIENDMHSDVQHFVVINSNECATWKSGRIGTMYGGKHGGIPKWESPDLMGHLFLKDCPN